MKAIPGRPTLAIAALMGAAVAATGAFFNPAAMPSAGAAPPCPDVQVVFARGTTEAPGVGGIGQAFVDAVRTQAGAKSVDVYAVNYPASTDFPTAADGIIDAGTHVREIAANCPDTKLVLGGYSQGAAVIGYLTADAIPAGFTPPAGITGPMPSEVADHVAAIALFGKPSNGFLSSIGAPPITIGSRYAAKTIDICNAGDPVCSGGSNNMAHALYAVNGEVGQAAEFAVRRL